MVDDTVESPVTFLFMHISIFYINYIIWIVFFVYTYKGVGESLTDPSVIKAEEKR